MTYEVDFPPDSKLLSAKTHGASFWAKPTKITLEVADGSTKALFLKIAFDDLGRSMLHSEYEGVRALHRVVPELLPRPIAWGAYKSMSSTYFYLADFVPMIEEVPEPQAFSALLARLHKESIPHSPNGKFGFHVQTFTVRSISLIDTNTWERAGLLL